MRTTQILDEQDIKNIIAKKFATSRNNVFINAADENGRITIQVDYDIIVFDNRCRPID